MTPPRQDPRSCASPPPSWRRGPLPAVLLAGSLALWSCGRPAVDDAEPTACRVQLLDAGDGAASLLQLLEIDDEHYVGTAGLDTAVPRSVELRVLAGDRLDVDRELIALTFSQLKKQYVMPISDQRRTFSSVPGHDCSAEERSLLYYLLLEWFPRL